MSYRGHQTEDSTKSTPKNVVFPSEMRENGMEKSPPSLPNIRIRPSAEIRKWKPDSTPEKKTRKYQ